jgi:two-component system phosphate regulon response regulator PhoB
MLPGGESGLDFAKALRADRQLEHIPVIMLTARVDNADKVAALDAGADDHVSKPFSPSELKARIRAVLRRSGSVAEANHEEVLEVEGLSLNVATRRVSADGVLVDLGPTEFRLLHFFMQHLERVYSRADLIRHLWPSNTHVEERTIDVHIRKLRSALESSRRRDMIQTVRSAGYRFSNR